jgi:hypothetical protein
MFWDIKVPLSYNALFNFIVGNRGSGKTHGAKQWCINDFINNGNQFVWTRRYDSEFDDFKTLRGKDAFFADIKHEYPDHKFEYKEYCFYIDGVIMGYGIPLSISAKKKSSSYPLVNKLIFDEFIITKGRSNYLRKEVEIFLDLYETVFRMREGKGAFFLANAITFTNPYFLYFDINKPVNKKGIMKQGDLLIQLVNNPDFIEAKKNTRFGKLIQGTEYGNFSIDNQFLLDNNNFILDHTPKDIRYFFTLKANGEHYGVWLSYGEGIMYVCKKFDPSYKLVYTTILDNHQPNTMLLKGKQSIVFNTFVNNFKNGCCFFDSIKTKNVVLDSIRYTL